MGVRVRGELSLQTVAGTCLISIVPWTCDGVQRALSCDGLRAATSLWDHQAGGAEADRGALAFCGLLPAVA